MRPNPANYFDQKQMFLGQLPRQIRTSAPSVNGCGAHLAPSPLCGDANTKAESQKGSRNKICKPELDWVISLARQLAEQTNRTKPTLEAREGSVNGAICNVLTRPT
jgi:anti-sigma factor ChrR (cupin superfamily)